MQARPFFAREDLVYTTRASYSLGAVFNKALWSWEVARPLVNVYLPKGTPGIVHSSGTHYTYDDFLVVDVEHGERETRRVFVHKSLLRKDEEPLAPAPALEDPFPAGAPCTLRREANVHTAVLGYDGRWRHGCSRTLLPAGAQGLVRSTLGGLVVVSQGVGNNGFLVPKTLVRVM